nr:retrovirus-related Pol polyprotein from transposon TNT 1-94 [Tanacetum cinerariifolium]
DNEIVEVKVLMALAEDNDAVNKEGAKTGEWVNISMRKHLKGQGGSSSRSRTPRPSKHFFCPCIHYGFNDHLYDNYENYPICDICRSYDHETYGHNMIISIKRGTKSRNPQLVMKSYETCGSTVHTTTDHNDIEWFKRGEALQAKKYKALKTNKIETSNASRSKTLTKRNNILVNFCDEKEISQNFSPPYTPEQNVYIHNHKDHLGKFDEKADDGYFLGYPLVSKAFRVFYTRRQQTKETYHITFDEIPDAIKLTKPSVNNINIAESKRYLPEKYLHPYEPSQRYQTNNNDVSFIELYETPEPFVLENEV